MFTTAAYLCYSGFFCVLTVLAAVLFIAADEAIASRVFTLPVVICHKTLPTRDFTIMLELDRATVKADATCVQGASRTTIVRGLSLLLSVRALSSCNGCCSPSIEIISRELPGVVFGTTLGTRLVATTLQLEVAQ